MIEWNPSAYQGSSLDLVGVPHTPILINRDSGIYMLCECNLRVDTPKPATLRVFILSLVEEVYLYVSYYYTSVTFYKYLPVRYICGRIFFMLVTPFVAIQRI